MSLVDPELLAILACPRCHAPVQEDDRAAELVCTAADCGLAYPVRDGIPVMLVDEARQPHAGAAGSVAADEPMGRDE